VKVAGVETAFLQYRSYFAGEELSFELLASSIEVEAFGQTSFEQLERVLVPLGLIH